MPCASGIGLRELDEVLLGVDIALARLVGVDHHHVGDARHQPDIAQGLAHGDVVNTASRLETGAPPGRLVVGAETYRALGGEGSSMPLSLP